MLETISISASAAAIFSAELGCGLAPPKRKDMIAATNMDVVWLARVSGGAMGCCCSRSKLDLRLVLDFPKLERSQSLGQPALRHCKAPRKISWSRWAVCVILLLSLE